MVFHFHKKDQCFYYVITQKEKYKSHYIHTDKDSIYEILQSSIQSSIQSSTNYFTLCYESCLSFLNTNSNTRFIEQVKDYITTLNLIQILHPSLTDSQQCLWLDQAVEDILDCCILQKVTIPIQTPFTELWIPMKPLIKILLEQKMEQVFIYDKKNV